MVKVRMTAKEHKKEEVGAEAQTRANLDHKIRQNRSVLMRQQELEKIDISTGLCAFLKSSVLLILGKQKDGQKGTTRRW